MVVVLYFNKWFIVENLSCLKGKKYIKIMMLEEPQSGPNRVIFIWSLENAGSQESVEQISKPLQKW